MNKDIIEKIKKLLALSESDNEHEANTSMLQAQNLLAKYKLSMKDIKDTDKEIVNVVNQGVGVARRNMTWRSQLACVIADNFSCYCYLSMFSDHTKQIKLLGKEDDVKICEAVIGYALENIDSNVNTLKKQYRKDRLSTRGLENTYALGFIKGLAISFEQQKKANEEEWGLVLAKDIEVEKVWEGMKFRKSRQSSLVTSGDRNVYDKAYKDGTEFNMSSKVGKGSDFVGIV